MGWLFTRSIGRVQEQTPARASTEQEREKELVGRYAASCVRDGMRVGLGSGSTVYWTVVALGERRPDILCTATSNNTRDLAQGLGLTVVAPDELGAVDLAIDGADEVDRDLNLTKGGGGALTREKIVSQMADRFIVVADHTKLVDRLGAFGTPLEMLAFAPGVLARRLRALGATRVHAWTGLSDNGNLLAKAHFGLIHDPRALSAALSAIPGIVEHGLFLADQVDRVIVPDGEGIRELSRG